ncbi:MAG: deoxyribose-phosphate aldolase [Pirellulaceae bacterium]|nr:deoxyribose-phosphate aldolase [Planctomycetaceae bacterium]
MDYTYLDIAKMIDHSLLVPTMTVNDLEAGIDLALAYDVASVCIMPYFLKLCAQRLAGSSVKASTTIGFPHGGHATAIKTAEAELAIEHGCQELDVVVNISQVLSENWDYVIDEIQQLVELAHGAGQKIKIIFENCFLTDAHKIRLCQICSELGADWVKTSTGYGTSGATVEDLQLMRQHAPPPVQVKAAGGVRDMDMILKVREIGVSRIGSSRTGGMLDECRTRLGLQPISSRGPETSGGY